MEKKGDMDSQALSAEDLCKNLDAFTPSEKERKFQSDCDSFTTK
jgi:hypothetical protein